MTVAEAAVFRHHTLQVEELCSLHRYGAAVQIFLLLGDRCGLTETRHGLFQQFFLAACPKFHHQLQHIGFIGDHFRSACFFEAAEQKIPGVFLRVIDTHGDCTGERTVLTLLSINIHIIKPHRHVAGRANGQPVLRLINFTIDGDFIFPNAEKIRQGFFSQAISCRQCTLHTSKKVHHAMALQQHQLLFLQADNGRGIGQKFRQSCRILIIAGKIELQR